MMRQVIQLAQGEAVIAAETPGRWTFGANAVRTGDGIEELRIELTNDSCEAFPEFSVQFLVPQQDIICRWHPNAFFNKSITAQLMQEFSAELASGAPVLALVGQDGGNRLVCAVSDALRKTVFVSGVREFTFEINNEIRFFSQPEPPDDRYCVTLRFDRRRIPFSDALTDAFRWYESFPEYHPAPVPEAAFLPLYSTWYSYHKELHEEEIEAECRIAAELGMAGVIVDDGWQTEIAEGVYDYCGDWLVAPGRIRDMAAHVGRIHDLGMMYILWYSVPFIGFKSRNYERFAGKYLYRIEYLNAAVLDPRFPEVREFLITLYLNALRDWKLDGFKLDFIDRFLIPSGKTDPALADDYAGRDFKSIPAATDALLTGIIRALHAVKPDILIEFRQKYMGPAIRKYGNLLRVSDCPGDITANRSRAMDLRLSSGGIAVHGDMLRWHPSENVESAARQLLAVLFAVPQISVRFEELPESHLAMIRHRLRFYSQHRRTLTLGRLSILHPEMNDPLVRAESECEAITALYCEGLVVACPALADGKIEVVVNATSSQSVMVKLPVVAVATLTDATGNPAGKLSLQPGIHELNIPLSGECFLNPCTEYI